MTLKLLLSGITALTICVYVHAQAAGGAGAGGAGAGGAAKGGAGGAGAGAGQTGSGQTPATGAGQTGNTQTPGTGPGGAGAGQTPGAGTARPGAGQTPGTGQTGTGQTPGVGAAQNGTAQGTGAPFGQVGTGQAGLYPPSIYQMNGVANAMNLTPQQIGQLNNLTQTTQNSLNKQYADLNALPADQRAARLQELNQQYNNTWMKGARGIFNDKQATRYQQLQYQYGGFSALQDPTIAQRLNLTQDQRNNLRSNMEWSNRELQAIQQKGATDRDHGMQLYRNYQKEYQNRFNKLLTPQQIQTWQQMTGEPYTFAPAFGTAPQANRNR